MNLRLVWIVASVWLGWAFLSSPLWSQAPELLLPLLGIAVLTLRPTFKWIESGGHSVPALEMYCLMHGVYYLLPALGEREDILSYSVDVRFRAVCVVGIFLSVVQLVGSWFDSQKPLVTGVWTWLAHRELDRRRVMPFSWAVFLFWIGFQITKFLRVIPDLGGVFRPLDTFIGAIGMFAVFYLGQSWGKGELDLQRKWMFIGGVALWLFLDLASGFLVGGITLFLLLTCAYVMGSHKLPVAASVAACVVVAFLSLGKDEMRTQFWDPGQNYSSTRLDPLQVFTFWMKASWENLDASSTSADPGVAHVLDRASLLHMLQLVVDETPRQRPYLRGLTYAQTFQLLVPRVLWLEKPRGTLPTETLAIYYEVQTAESTNSTSIGIGQIAEAWANFGWLGVIGSATVFGFLLSIPGRLSAFGLPQQARVLLAITSVPLAIDLEHCLGQWFVILVNSFLVASVFLFVVCKKIRFEDSRYRLELGSGNKPSVVQLCGSAHQ